LSIDPKLPKQWKGISFKINFKGEYLTVEIDGKNCKFTWNGNNPIDLNFRNKLITVNPKKLKKAIYS
jgi:maltose phosphorylase